MPSFDQSEIKKREFLVAKDGDTGNIIKVIFPNGIQVGIPGYENFNNGITLSNGSTPPKEIANTLYLVNDNLYFNGQLMAVSGSVNVSVKDEGVVLTTSLSSLNFVGSGITATSVGSSVTVTSNVDGADQILAVQIFG